MTSRPVRSAAMNASRNLRDSSSSPELSPPPPPKRARAAKQYQSSQNSRLNKSTGTKPKRGVRTVEPEPAPEVIEILDSDDDGGLDAEIDEEVPELIEEIPPLSGEMFFAKVRLDGGLSTDTDEEGLWWPADVVKHHDDGTLDVFLLSTVQPGVSRRLIVPAALRDSVVRPMRNGLGVLSANVSSYRVNVEPNKLSVLASKRLDAGFRRALEGMNAGDDDAEFPTISTLLASNTNATHQYQAPVVKQTTTWTPPGPERNLEIPGELVLATQNKPARIRPTTEFWAGRIDAYVAPRNSKTPPRYTVTFFEGTVDDLERSQFYTAAEEYFMTCPLGKVASNDTVNDVDEESSASPEPDIEKVEPAIPPPPPAEFDELSLIQQFAYTVPILKAIIDNKYEPARSLHEKFAHGGATRAKLKQQSPSIGQMRETTVKKFWELVDRWALGLETRIVIPDSSDCSMNDHSVPQPVAREGSADTDCIPNHPPSSLPSSSWRALSTDSSPLNTEFDSTISLPSRPRGCEYYESLTLDERREYCSLILHREGVLQLLLWREGKRHILQPDSAEVEDGLHRLAVELSKQGDILTLVMALRQQRLGLANLKRESTLVGPKALARTGSGTRSRPRQGSFRSS